MTGFGEARLQESRWSIQVEIRTVNNRHFKLGAKISDPYSALEPEVDRLVREKVRRGSVQISIRIDRPRRPEDYRLNAVALSSYRDQLRHLFGAEGTGLDFAPLLALPGVVEEIRPAATAPADDWPAIAGVVMQALDQLDAARMVEGKAMAKELAALGKTIAEHLARIADRGPHVVASYQARLCDRIQNLVREQGVTIDPKDLIREVAILAERSDISEEIIRLRAHLVQFAETLDESDSAGRKLEFIAQEMGREVNTIGSKANDVEISREAVEIKGALEKIRELIQNVE
jgi:uncharacterized protein (TIGR00255 family)